MWCWCSHIATPIYTPSVTATSLPRRRCHAVSMNQQQQIPKEGDEAQISGSDVLWALQRASAVKKIKKKKKKKHDHGRGLSSAATPMEDYTNVRPLSININWAAKLDDLEKRLQHLSQTISI